MYAKVTIRDYQITLKVILVFLSLIILINRCMYIFYLFEVWDTAGQERFRSLVPMYYRNSDAVAIIFDVSDTESFNQVKNWINGRYNILMVTYVS